MAYLSRSMHGTGVRGRRMTSALLLPGPSHALARQGVGVTSGVAAFSNVTGSGMRARI